MNRLVNFRLMMLIWTIVDSTVVCLTLAHFAHTHERDGGERMGWRERRGSGCDGGRKEKRAKQVVADECKRFGQTGWKTKKNLGCLTVPLLGQTEAAVACKRAKHTPKQKKLNCTRSVSVERHTSSLRFWPSFCRWIERSRSIRLRQVLRDARCSRKASLGNEMPFALSLSLTLFATPHPSRSPSAALLVALLPPRIIALSFQAGTGVAQSLPRCMC